MKKCIFPCLLLIILLCGCSSQEPDDLYGFTSHFSSICEEKLEVSEFLKYEKDGVKVYARFFDMENGTVMLTVRENAESRKISSCSVTGAKACDGMEKLFLNVCRTFTTLTDDECANAVKKCQNGDYEYGSFVFSFDENEYAACFNVDNNRFYSHCAQISGQ
ncbi:MAG: hypothetical protein MJ177_05010 [Clostridia bacterium]|nr:hypothetical protein [Clostridia bacterium]